MGTERCHGGLSLLIVDDEPLAREGLQMLLAGRAGISTLWEAKSGAEAIALIRRERPDLVLLDVQMPEIDGFAVVQEVGADHMPAVIFVTAHDQYAIRAFEINAIDYLLKPVARGRFEGALERAKARLMSRDNITRRMVSLLETLASPAPQYLTRLAIRALGKTLFVNVADIVWIQAAENYVQLHTATARHLLHTPISTLQASLNPAVFLRVHRSVIVNVRHIKELEVGTHGDYTLVLGSGLRLQASRAYHDRIKSWASNPF